MAALTASSEDVEQLSKTFKMARPSLDDINQSVNQSGSISPVKFASATPVKPIQSKSNELPPAPGKNKTIMIGFAVLIALVLVFVILR